MEKEKYTPVAHICGTVLLLAAIQWGFVAALILIYDITITKPLMVFFISSAAYHTAMAAFLLIQRKDFYNIEHKRFLLRINIPNYLSLFRLSSMPTVTLLLVLAWQYPIAIIVLVFTAIVFLTDFLDGYIARKTNQITRIGRYLDSMSDYAILIVISIVFYNYHLIPMWFLWVVIARLFIQGIGMGVLLLIKGKVRVESSFLAKTSIFSIMVVYGLHILSFFYTLEILNTYILPIVDIIASIILAISLAEKLAKLWQYSKLPPEEI
ncbi:CDP-alcohol phosphatidyltransferase family protein [Spirochaetia bacterium 38H-sp]|uniref:CDP-alcohol phosphatidyltransferase family protein n=1 Tax=Rarispira pelagica TaxID=3141764 RepID=A0ABU9UBS3_9SPIR